MRNTILVAFTMLGMQTVAISATYEPPTDPPERPEPMKIVYVPLVPAASAAGDPGMSPYDRATWDILMQTVDAIEMRDVKLRDAIDQLATARRLNLFVDWLDLAEHLRIPADTPTRVSLRGVTLATVLQVVLDSAAGAGTLSFVIQDGVVRVVREADLHYYVETRFYYCGDLVNDFTFDQVRRAVREELKRITQMRDPERANVPPSGEARSTEKEALWALQYACHDYRSEQILDLIRDSIEPDSWREYGGTVGAMIEMDGFLVVTHTAAVQHRVAEFLLKFRRARGMRR